MSILVGAIGKQTNCPACGCLDVGSLLYLLKKSPVIELLKQEKYLISKKKNYM